MHLPPSLTVSVIKLEGSHVPEFKNKNTRVCCRKLCDLSTLPNVRDNPAILPLYSHRRYCGILPWQKGTGKWYVHLILRLFFFFRSAHVWQMFSRDLTVLSAHPHVHPQLGWAIPAFAFPAIAGTHLPTPDGWQAELASVAGYVVINLPKGRQPSNC